MSDSDVSMELDDPMPSENEGANEVFELLKPHLSSPNPENEKLLKDRISFLGVKNLSAVPLFKDDDFPNLIPPMEMRLMLSNYKSNSSSSKTLETSHRKSGTYHLDLKSLLSPKFFEKLQKDKEILSKQDRKKLVVSIADDIKDNVSVIRKKDVLAVSKTIVKSYPTSLGCLMADDTDLSEAAASLASSIRHHIFYTNSLLKEKQSSSDGTPAKRRFSKSQSNGLDPERDNPTSLPDGETLETQEAKRLLMVEMETSGSSVNWTVISKLMSETYCSQRSDINEGLAMDKLLKRWPYIGKHSILQSHFEYLKDLKVSEAMQGAETLFPNLHKFFEAESHKKRKGKCAEIPKQLKEVLLKYQQQNDENREPKHFIAIIMCALIYMEIPLEEMFLLFEEETCYNEVQASDRLPSHPIIAVIGNDIQFNPPAYIAVDKTIISEATVSVSKAIKMLIMAYFVFKIEFPTRSAGILHFLQRKIFNINDEGTRTERKKTKKGYTGAPPEIPNMLLRLMRHFKEYCLEWNIADTI